MPTNLPPRRHLFAGAANSNLTGDVWYAGDFARLTISVQTSTASASRFTVVGTNLDGFQAALPNPSQTIPANNWSVVTVITVQGVYTIDPGVRWLNVFRPDFGVSATSNTTITATGAF